MTCGAVWVELGPAPELDRLRRCTLYHCGVHAAQLAWVHADHARTAEYDALVRRWQRGGRAGTGDQLCIAGAGPMSPVKRLAQPTEHGNSLVVDEMGVLMTCLRPAAALVLDLVQAYRRIGRVAVLRAQLFGDVVQITWPYPGRTAAERRDFLVAKGVHAKWLHVEGSR